MSISAAMDRAEQALFRMTDSETGEFIFYQKERLVEQIVIEVLIGFFQDSDVVKMLIEDARK